jgi:hypothetical protein
MRSRLGHRIVWYMVMNVLEEHFRSIHVFSGRQRMEVVYPDVKSSVPTYRITSSHNPKYYIFELLYLAFSVYNITSHYKPNKY